ncbi:MAG: hypothetical protein DMF50_12060 [Acidobacteria bacterium]|nr:MAG: hypothetical protein DMF50_12060 [Acidobacteriota bacterium]
MPRPGEARPIGNILPIVFIALAMAASRASLGQEGGAPQGAPPTTQTPPESTSPFLVREYQIKPKKLWKAVLELLRESGYPPEETDESTMRVKTSFVDFDQKSFTEQVADPPPRLGSDYHIMQMNKVVGGKVSLEAVVAPKDGGSQLQIRARILVEGLDRQRHVRVLVDRRSSGVIEGDLLIKLHDRLGIKPS